MAKKKCCVCGKRGIPVVCPLVLTGLVSSFNPPGKESWVHRGKCYREHEASHKAQEVQEKSLKEDPGGPGKD